MKAICNNYDPSVLTDEQICAEVERRGILYNLVLISEDQLVKELGRRGYILQKTGSANHYVDIVHESALPFYTDQDLAKELRARGWTLTAHKTITINLDDQINEN